MRYNSECVEWKVKGVKDRVVADGQQKAGLGRSTCRTSEGA